MFREDASPPQPQAKEGFIIDFSKKKVAVGADEINKAVQEVTQTTGIEQQLAHEKVVSLSLAYLGKYFLSAPKSVIENTAADFKASFASLPPQIRINYFEQFLTAWDHRFNEYPTSDRFYSVREYLKDVIPIWRDTLSGSASTTIDSEIGFNYLAGTVKLDEESARFLSQQPIDLSLVLIISEWKDREKLGQRIKKIKEVSQQEGKDKTKVPYRLLSQEVTDEMFDELVVDLAESSDKDMAFLSIDNYLRLKRELLIKLYGKKDKLDEKQEFLRTNFEQNHKRAIELVDQIPVCMIVNSDFLDDFTSHGFQSSAATAQRLDNDLPKDYYGSELDIFPSAPQYVYGSFGKFDPAYLGHVRRRDDDRVSLGEKSLEQKAFAVFVFLDPTIMDKPETIVTRDELIELQTASFLNIRMPDEEVEELFRNALAKRRFDSQVLVGRQFKELKAIDLAQRHPYDPKIEFVRQYENRKPLVGENMQKDWYAEEVKIRDGIEPSAFMVFIVGNQKERDILIAKGIPQEKVALKGEFIESHKDPALNFTEEDIVRITPWISGGAENRIDRGRTEINYYARTMGLSRNKLLMQYRFYLENRSHWEDDSGLASLASAGINYMKAQ